jgi:O-antigen ligase
MLPLLFILLITGLGMLISFYFSSEITWFTFYIGGIAGIFVSGMVLELWNRRKRVKEQLDKGKKNP